MTALSRSGWRRWRKSRSRATETLAAFLQKRMAPAMRTCRSVEDRQQNLSQKLSRAANLLRTWVDVALQNQNSDLLASMNRRARQQLRLQQTVEGLSVAAVSYYVVGLFGYLVKGFEHTPARHLGHNADGAVRAGGAGGDLAGGPADQAGA